MTLVQRFKRLTFWNKFGVVGALASIVGVVLAALTLIDSDTLGAPQPARSDFRLAKEVREILHAEPLAQDPAKWPAPNPSAIRQVIQLGRAEPIVVTNMLRNLLTDSDVSVSSGAAVSLYWLQVIDAREMAEPPLFVDISGANLRGADLSELDMAGADLSDADLRGANLRAIFLGSAHLSNADLHGADLTDAVLSGALLGMAMLDGAKLDGADLTGAALCLAGSICEESLTEIAGIRGARVHDLVSAPPGFIEWAVSNGALNREFTGEEASWLIAEDKARLGDRIQFINTFRE